MKKIAAYDLVRMSAQELASSEEKKWREQKTEEFLKQSVLDTDTAASFSTAAALKISKDLQKERQDAVTADTAIDTGGLGDLQVTLNPPLIMSKFIGTTRRVLWRVVKFCIKRWCREYLKAGRSFCDRISVISSCTLIWHGIEVMHVYHPSA